ncbi:MAG: hypothetical protein VKL39_22650, partial [Leptolyngbyaceae bacterium]|nr:hypothetical protein [Leptolyngbyaceae bacterium]
MDTQLHPLHSFIKKALLFLQKQLALNVQLNAELAETHEKFGALKHQNYFVKTLLEQGLSLYQCTCQQDIYHVLEKYTNRIFPGSSGYIQVFDSGVEDLCDFYEW